MTNYRRLIACSDVELARVDPLVMNLLVAQSIPSLSGLDICRYQRLADQWAEDVRGRLPSAEKVFWQSPQDWKNDVNFFRLGVLCGYLEHGCQIAYIEDQKYATEVSYTDPSDLFLNGGNGHATRHLCQHGGAARGDRLAFGLAGVVGVRAVALHLPVRRWDGDAQH